MKTVFFGGGSHRLVGIIREALREPGIFGNGGELYLYDLNVQRAEAVGRIVMQTPEFKRGGVSVKWGANLDEALPGADAVTVTLAAGTPLSRSLTETAGWKHGFMGSDNLSPSGSMHGVVGAPIFVQLARKMEQHCPDAWLIDFANPVAVLAGMVSRNTKIKALGVCGGFQNHRWDLARIFGKDEPRTDIDVHVAGINHLSYILNGTIAGRDLFEALDERLTPDWQMCPFDPRASEGLVRNATNSVKKLIRFYKELGVLIFSTEGDGMFHLDYEANFERDNHTVSRAEIDKNVEADIQKRAKENAEFEAHATRNLDDAFWNAQGTHYSKFAPATGDIFISCLRAISGVEKMKLVTSYLNNGAIEGLPDNHVVEYSQYLYKQTIQSAGRYKLPGVVYGLTAGLASHQTLLGDACFAEDPKLLAEAFLAYPVRPFSSDAKALYRELIEINKDLIPAPLARAVEYLK